MDGNGALTAGVMLIIRVIVALPLFLIQKFMKLLPSLRVMSLVPKPRALVNVLLAGLAYAGPAAALRAVDYYQRFDQTYLNQNWNLVSASGHTWALTPKGSPSHTGEFDFGGHYHNNGFVLRTGAEPDSAVFLGASLTLSGGGLSLRRVVANGTSTVSTLIIDRAGSRITNDISNTTALHAEALIVNGTLGVGPQTSSSRTVLLTAGRVTGNGDIATLAPSRAFVTQIGFVDASSYTGNIVHTTGVLGFTRDLLSAGALIIDGSKADGSAPPTVVLNRELTFTSVIIGGAPLPDGRYSFAELKAAHGRIFTEGDASGFIVVATEG